MFRTADLGLPYRQDMSLALLERGPDHVVGLQRETMAPRYVMSRGIVVLLAPAGTVAPS
jgi:hypothetical protein